MSLNFDIDNDIDFDLAANSLNDDIPGALRDILEVIGERTDDVIPFEIGTLQGSKDMDVDEKNNEGAIGYDTPYAIKQHEDCSLSHDQGRKCKYLERTVKKHQDTFKKIWEKKFGGLF